jgi:hypothetical protein
MDIAANTTVVKLYSNFGVLVSAAEQKITAAQVMADCPEQLVVLGEQAAAHLTEAYTHKEMCEQHLAKAKEVLAQVRALCDDDGFAAFYDIFHKTFCSDVGRSRTYELLALATGKTSIEDARAKTRERVARHRAKKAESVTVTDSYATDTCGNINDVSSMTSAEERKAQNAHLFPEIKSSTGVANTPTPSNELLEYWKIATAEEKRVVLKHEGVDALLELQKDDADFLANLYDRVIGLQVALASPVVASNSSKNLLTNLTGTMHWALGQDDPASGAQALKIIKGKLIANKRDPNDICLSFAKTAKR